jgi:uncharacterized protein (TIGR02147 family)
MAIDKKQLTKAAQRMDLTIFLDPHAAFAAIYETCKSSVPDLTYKSFSEALELGSANANLIATGKRELTIKAAEKIADALELGRDQRKYFVTLAAYMRERQSVHKDALYETLMRLKAKHLPSDTFRKQLEFFQHWYHAAIVELLSLPHAKDDVEWIASCLNPRVSVPEVKNSLKLLESLGYIARDPERGHRFTPTRQVYSTGDEVQGMAFYRFHQQMIDLARLALDEVPYEEREISAITVACTPELRNEMKKRVIAFRKELLTMTNNSNGATEVVQLNFQLFPIAQMAKGKKS